MEINTYEIDWWAWPSGARIPSSGTETEYGASEGEAIRRFLQRFPGVDRIKNVRKIRQKKPE